MSKTFKFKNKWKFSKKGECLNKSEQKQMNLPDIVPMGLVYDKAHQCRLFYGVNATLCSEKAVSWVLT